MINSVSAQNKLKKDTIYYLLDTLKTSINDRLVTSEIEDGRKIITVNCHCLKNGDTPQFIYTIKFGLPLKKKIFKSLKLVKLSDLIDLTRKNDFKTFLGKYVLFIIEPLGHNYIMYKSLSVGGTSHSSDDTIYN